MKAKAVFVSLMAMVKLLFCTNAVGGGVIQGPIVNPGNGHVYYLLEAASWTASEVEAVALNGHLVTIDDQVENDWVFDTFANSQNLWIGFYQPAGSPEPSGGWQWISGEATAYGNWDTNEPNQWNGLNEDFAHIWGHPEDIANDPSARHARRWNDLPDIDPPLGIHPPFGVVEVIPEPSTFILLTIAALGFILGWWRRRR